LIQNSGVHPAGGGQFGHAVEQPLKLSDIPVVQALVFLCEGQHRDIALGGGLQQALAERHL
jgi:hypothetical protein